MAPTSKNKNSDREQAGKQVVKVDRRKGEDRRQTQQPVKVERRKAQRRRQIDPTTCERDYSNDEIEFMQALDEYKRKSGRMFPTCSEILEVVRSLGYTREQLSVDGDPISAEESEQPIVQSDPPH